MQDVVLPLCLHCGSRDVVYKTKAEMWECQSCESRFEGLAPQTLPSGHSRLLAGKTFSPKAIFFSYGHDANKELVDRFKADIERRGHSVWIDYKEIGTWHDWRGKITQGIHESELAVAFLSRHATREPGVCRNEIAMALNRFGTVYPVLLEPIQEVIPPVTISHLQWQDLSQWRDIRDGRIEGKDWARWYEEKLVQLITLVEGEASEFTGDIQSLREVLRPVSLTSDIARHIPDFSGRTWVFDAYQHWLDNQNQSRLFWIKAGPGVGKTAIAAMLAHTYQSAVVGAWFCQANSIERRDTHTALCSLAFQLACRWDDYRRKVRFQLGFRAGTQAEDWPDLRANLLKKNEADLFNFLFAEPLNGLIWRGQRLVVVIDALDEATDVHGQNPLVDLLVTRLANLPSWLTFVVTSRPNPEVVAKLQGYAPFELDAQDRRIRDDLKAYLAAGLAKQADFSCLPEAEQARVETMLLANSDGMILYLQQILKGLEEGALIVNTLENVPSGLNSLYRIAFDHHFGGEKLNAIYHNEVKPLLRLLLAASEPLPSALAQQVLGWDRETYLRRRNRLGAYVLDTPQGGKLFHKTLYEWLGGESSAPYYLDAQHAQQSLAEYLWQCFDGAENWHSLEWRHQTEHWLPDLMSLLPQWNDADALGRLGNYLRSANRFTSAERLFRRALAIREKTFGDGHPVIANSLDDIARNFVAQGRDIPAEPLYRRALAIRENALGPEHPDVATSLHNLADFLTRQFKVEEAEPLHRRALAIRENALGPEHPDVAKSLVSVEDYFAWTDKAGRKALLERALAIQEKVLGPDHPDLMNALDRLASVQTDEEAGIVLSRRSLAIAENAYGPEDHRVARLLNNLAIGLLRTPAGEEAETLYRRAVSNLEEHFGPDNGEVVEAIEQLANCLEERGNYAAAAPLRHRVLAFQETIRDVDPEMAAELAANFENAKRWVHAQDTVREAKRLAQAQEDVSPAPPQHQLRKEENTR